MALNLSGTSGITGAGIGTIGPSGANVTGVVTCTSVVSSGAVSGTTGTFTSNVAVTGVSTFTGDVSFAGASYNAMWDKSKNALVLNDNTQLNFGTDEDGDIYHDNSQMIINNATGTLRIRSSEVRLCNPTNSTYFTGTSGGAAKLYHNDTVKLETTASGVKIEGGGGNGLKIENSGGTNAAVIDLKNTLTDYVQEYRLAVAGSDGAYGTAKALFVRDQTAGANRFEIQSGGDVRIGTGDLYFGGAGKGVVLGSTTNVDANTLDDYEEGTWTIGNVSALSGNAQVNTASYTRIGNTCTIAMNIFSNSNDMSSGGVTLTGLPFTVKDHQGIFLGGYNNKDSSGVYINSTSIIIMSGVTGARHIWANFTYIIN